MKKQVAKNTHPTNSYTSASSAENKSAFQLHDNRSAAVIQKKQLDALAEKTTVPVQKKANHTGLPDQLKSGIENLSGHSMDDVKVHYNSDKPAQLSAHAYAQGTDIHLAAGQEKHLPHEAWHVVQQKQGRVKPTVQVKGTINVNDDQALEKEADLMGAKASGKGKSLIQPKMINTGAKMDSISDKVFQLATRINHTTSNFSYTSPLIGMPVTEPVGVHMTAVLDPLDIATGSATQPGGPQANLIARMNALYGGMVRGHLLNHDLGGFAVENNLFPITNAANVHIHSPQVERGVKAALTHAHGNQLAGIQPDGVYYSVEVDSGMSETKIAAGSDFVCHAHYINDINGAAAKGNNIVDVTVSSKPQGPPHAASYNTADGTAPGVFPLAGPTPGWTHAGQGARGGAWAAETGPAGHIRTAHENNYLTRMKMLSGRGMRAAKRHKEKLIAGGIALGAIAGYFFR